MARQLHIVEQMRLNEEFHRIAARDAELAEAVMRMHILGARRFLLDRSDG